MSTRPVTALLVLVLASTACNSEDPGQLPPLNGPATPSSPDAASPPPTADESPESPSPTEPNRAPVTERDRSTQEQPTAPGQPVTVTPLDTENEAFGRLQNELIAARQNSPEQLSAAHPAPAGLLSYDPSTALGLDAIASALNLGADELARLNETGVIVSKTQQFPSFAYGYETLYMQDLPLFISADSILQAVHRSYDDLLRAFEFAIVIQDLDNLLDELRTTLPTLQADAQTVVDLDLYLAVAQSLLVGQVAAPVAGADAAEIQAFVSSAEQATGLRKQELFGVSRNIDFSQFTPRGHYTQGSRLSQYFRAMIWLGRIDFRLLETQGDGSQVFHRRQFDAIHALAQLFGEAQHSRFTRIDAIVRAFVGEPDYMMLPELQRLLEDLGGAEAAQASTDTAIAQAIVDGGYGVQRIASHLAVNDTSETLPLNRSFALFGQRYTVDSHVFSNVTWDRTEAMRMLPDPLDVAFAALGNNAAGTLLQPQLQEYQYAGDLQGIRLLVDRHEPNYWTSNLYNTWMGTLRALSTPPTEGSELVHTLPWARRILNTQLASWAELRHDTILYVKQSYTTTALCEFPDARVEPYPEFYTAPSRLRRTWPAFGRLGGNCRSGKWLANR